MKVVDVDLEKCQGHGKCYMVAPDLFDFEDDHGRSRWVGDPIDPTKDTETMEAAERAVSSCPESALSFRDTD